MALSVQTNTAAMTALKHLNANNSAMNSSLERLSSGFRINNAADDASGFAVSSKLNAQTERLKAASQNATQAQAMVKMADAGVNEIQNMVTRIQTLAVQASSANAAGELNKLDAERIKLESAIDKIANSTNFNGVNLLNGQGASGTGQFTSTFANGGAVANVATASVTSASNSTLNGSYGIGTDASGGVFLTQGGTATVVSTTAAFAANSTVSLTALDGAKVDITFGSIAPTISLSGTGAAGAATNAGLVTVSGQEKYTAVVDATTADTFDANAATISASVISSAAVATYTLQSTGTVTAAGALQISVLDGGSTVVGTHTFASGTAANQDVTLTNGDVINVAYNGTATVVSGATTEVGLGSLLTNSSAAGTSTFQVGADNDANNQVTINLTNSYTSTALGLGGGDLLTQSNAQAYIDTAKAALNTVVQNRADLGSTQNQVAFVQANLATSIEQATASVSSIRDADMAQEMAMFTKNQILTQASTSMLAQANQAAQNVMTLFR